MMSKLAFAALGLITRAGRSLAAFMHDKANPAVDRITKKSRAAHKSERATPASAKRR
jgi:hypothetical protein